MAAFEGTIECRWAPVWVADSDEELRADFIVTFSARPQSPPVLA